MNEITNFLKYQQAVDEGWERLSFVIEVDKHFYKDTKITESFDYAKMNEWCINRCKGDWLIAGGTVLLKDPRDAMLFKLTFWDNYSESLKEEDDTNS